MAIFSKEYHPPDRHRNAPEPAAAYTWCAIR